MFLFWFSDVLGISPSKEKLTRVLTNTLKGIPTVLCANAVPMDGSITEPPPTETQVTVDESDSSLQKSDPAKSTSDSRYIHSVIVIN